MKKYSLYELQSYLQRVIALNFQEPIWVIAEIYQLKNNRGHSYIELVQKNTSNQEVCAQCQAVIWSKNIQKIKQATGPVFEDLVREGTEVSLQVEVTHHPIYGLKLSVLNIDASHTLGKMELQRQETILRLKKEDLLEKNTLLSPTPVLQRIAIISSPGASGYLDFVNHLNNNDYGYRFYLRLYASSVQGSQMEEDIVSNFKKIDRSIQQFDCVVIIRGGGSKIDLAGFDLYGIARAISLCNLPVLTGIGHETDSTVADLVAYRSFKTPTAVANFLIDYNANFEGRLSILLQSIVQNSRKIYTRQKETMQKLNQEINDNIYRLAERERNDLIQEQNAIRSRLKQRVEKEFMVLEHIGEKIKILSPFEILKKGYTMTRHEGKVLKNKGLLRIGDAISTIFVDGEVKSRIEQIN
ncbi:MAG: exodeoxyribonuclease VII large subunit [Saprospiraceae bacterium]|nr:exodeoxyribonuclease VII large subunit [Saprospiraceae bacterium]